MISGREFIYSPKEYYNRILNFNANSGGFYRMNEGFLPLMDKNQHGREFEWNIGDTINKNAQIINRFAGNLAKEGVDLMQNVTSLAPKPLVIEKITSFYAHTAWSDDQAFCLIEDNMYEFEYTRITDPESTAYMDIYRDEMHWIGYRDERRKIKHRATTLLALYLAEHNPEKLLLQVLLPEKTTRSNKMCKIYETLNFQYDGITNYSCYEMWGGCYRFRQLKL